MSNSKRITSRRINMKKRYPIFLSAALLFGVVTASTSCSLLNRIFNGITDAMGISLAETNKTCVVGQTFRLVVYITDDEGNKREYTNFESYSFWSTNPEVAEVEGGTGVVTCKKAGSCVINYNALGIESSAIGCSLTVQEKQLVNFKINRFKSKYPVDITIEELRAKLDYSASAVYQNGYEESVIPSVNLDSVNTSIIGSYPIYFEYTLNGVTKREDKTLEIANASDIDDRIPLERNITDYIRNSNYPVTGIPTQGNIKELVIPIKFTDSDTWISSSGYNNIREDIQKIFYSTNPEVDLGGFESVKTYYAKESKVDGIGSSDAGLIQLSGTVANWYQDTHESSEYLKDLEEMTSDEKKELTEIALEKRAVDWYFANNPTDSRKNYDSDGDGFLDSVCFIYGRPDYTGLGEKKNDFWYHVSTSNSQSGNIDNPQYSTETMLRTRTGKSDYLATSYHFESYAGATLSARTYIHEHGHMFGLDDYYSYSTSDSFASGNTMQTNNVGGHDPYSLLLLNWAKPYIPAESMTISIGDIQRTHDVILLSPNWDNDARSPFDEYVLIELFAPTGLNTYDATIGNRYGNFSTVGLRIWHVDSRLAKKTAKGYEDTTYVDPTAGGTYSLITDNSPRPDDTDDPLLKFDKYQQLYLIRNDKTMTYQQTEGSLKESDYFVENDTFDFASYSKQFVETGTLNNGQQFKWTVHVDDIFPESGGYGVTLTLTKSA